MGVRHVETCEDITDSDDKVFVRYYVLSDKKPAPGGYQFCMRKHDIEEFTSVAARHGSWERQLGRLVDVIVKAEPDLFSKQKAQK
jgi:hypothetical protein